MLTLQERSSKALSGPNMREEGVVPIAEGLKERRTLARSKMRGTWGSAKYRILCPYWIIFNERFHTTTNITHPNGTIGTVRIINTEF
jgi:hypothetical protein